MSRDGRYVAFTSFASNLVGGDTTGSDAFRRDMSAGVTVLVSQGNQGPGNQWSGNAGMAISGDGMNVVFHSYADNLVPGDTNVQGDIFRWRPHPPRADSPVQ